MLEEILHRTTGALLRAAVRNRVSAPVRQAMTHTRKAMHKDLPRETSIGARILVSLAINDVALMRALIRSGTQREAALEIVAHGNRRIFYPLFAFLRHFGHYFGASPLKRVGTVYNLMNRYFPFSSPGWQSTVATLREQETAIDYTRCPLAEFTKSQGATDLCTASMCSLDHDIAAALNVKLVREETIAKGCSRCSFRWQPADTTKPVTMDLSRSAQQRADNSVERKASSKTAAAA